MEMSNFLSRLKPVVVEHDIFRSVFIFCLKLVADICDFALIVLFNGIACIFVSSADRFSVVISQGDFVSVNFYKFCAAVPLCLNFFLHFFFRLALFFGLMLHIFFQFSAYKNRVKRLPLAVELRQ